VQKSIMIVLNHIDGSKLQAVVHIETSFLQSFKFATFWNAFFFSGINLTV